MTRFLLPFVLIAPVAEAQESRVCYPHQVMVDLLDARFGEYRTHAGLVPLVDGGSLLVELYVSDDGSWSLIGTTPEGHSCVITGGDNWGPAPSDKQPGMGT